MSGTNGVTLIEEHFYCKVYEEPLDTKTVWSKFPVVTCGLKAITMDTVLIAILLDRFCCLELNSLPLLEKFISFITGLPHLMGRTFKFNRIRNQYIFVVLFMEKTERQINRVRCPGGSVVCKALEYAFEQWYWLPKSDAASKGKVPPFRSLSFAFSSGTAKLGYFPEQEID
ncbi:hypothetical protein ACRRTK_017270 [Alexandromys fortis]